MTHDISSATAQDLVDINRIYNKYVYDTHITFDLEPWSLQKRQQWFTQFDLGPYALFVAKHQNQVIGFAYTSAFRPKQAYQQSAEVTIYTNTALAPKGTGSALYDVLIQSAQTNFHRLYAVIALPNEASMNLHKKWGFSCVGQLSDVGYKFGHYYSVNLLEKRLHNRSCSV